MLSEYSPSSDMILHPFGSGRPRLNTEDARAASMRICGLIFSLSGSVSPSSSPLTASWQQREGSGRSRQGSGAILRTMSAALRMKESRAAGSMLFVEKLPNLPSANSARLSDLSEQ